MGAVRIRQRKREIATQPVILWMLLGGKPKWLPLNFGFNDVMRTAPIGKLEWRLFIFISREGKWGTLKSAGNRRCAVPAESHSIWTDRRRPGPAAALQVSPTSDTCQSVAI